MINSVYDYYVSTYGNRTISRHDSHKRSELRDIYNSIVKLNRAAPIYKFDLSVRSQKLAIDIKEAARSLTDNLCDITDIAEGTTPLRTVAVSDNPAVVTAGYIGSGGREGDALTFDVKQLAEPQINLGEYLPAGARNLYPGTYSFDIENSGTVYELQFTVNDGDNNSSVQTKLAKLINDSGIGLKAEVVQNEYAQRALRITSESAGSPKGSPYLFRITENSASTLSGAVNVFGLDRVEQYPANAVFDLNGHPTISESNTFTVNNEYEITLNATSEQFGPAQVVQTIDGKALTEQFSALTDRYNHLLDLSRSQDSHELRRLRSDITSVVKKYQEQLAANGITVREDYSLAPDQSILDETVREGTLQDRLKGLEDFKDALKSKVRSIEVNPMEYVNKKIVAYKNPQKLIAAPYSTSIYTGMMFDRQL